MLRSLILKIFKGGFWCLWEVVCVCVWRSALKHHTCVSISLGEPLAQRPPSRTDPLVPCLPGALLGAFPHMALLPGHQLCLELPAPGLSLVQPHWTGPGGLIGLGWDHCGLCGDWESRVEETREPRAGCGRQGPAWSAQSCQCHSHLSPARSPRQEN